MPIEPEVEKIKEGRIVVKEFCQSDNHHDVLCIGDIGAIKDSSGKTMDPTLVQIGISQAIYLAHVIPEYLVGKPMKSLIFIQIW